VGIRIPVRLRTIEQVVRREHGFLRQLTAPERRILSKWVRVIELAIEAAWPVETGTSRDGFRTVISGNPSHPAIGGYGFLITNPVGYVQFIRRAGEKQSGLSALWRRLIPVVVRRFQSPLNAELTAEIIRTETRIRSGVSLQDLLQQPTAPPRRVTIRLGLVP
jgi:hypothetical protein